MSDDVVIRGYDDGTVSLLCSREECQEPPRLWSVDLPQDCTLEHAIELTNAHRATHSAH